MLESLEVLKRLAGLGIRFQIGQSDLLFELEAEFNMNNHPLWVVAFGLGVVVGMLRVEGRLCREISVRFTIMRIVRPERDRPSTECS